MASIFKRRLPRYSLATLLLVMTVLAVWLGLATQKARQQKIAVASLQSFDARIFYDYESCEDEDLLGVTSMGQLYNQFTGRSWCCRDVEPPGPQWLRTTLGEDFFQTVIGVSTWVGNENNLTAEHMRQLGTLHHLKYLNLDSAASLRDDHLKHISRLTQTERLYLNNTALTDEGLRHLSGLSSLEYLGLGRTKITDNGLKHLRRLRKLEMLELSGTEITDAGLKNLQPLTNLNSVYADGTNVTKQGVREFEAANPGCDVLLSPPGIIGSLQPAGDVVHVAQK